MIMLAPELLMMIIPAPELLTNDGLVPGVHHTGQLVTVMVKSDEIIATIRAQTLALSAPSGAIRIVQGNMYYTFLYLVMYQIWTPP